MDKSKWEYKKLGEVCTKASSNIVLNRVKDNVGDYPLYGAKGFVQKIDFYQQPKAYIGIVKDGSVGKVNIYPAKSSLVGTMQYILPTGEVSLSFLKYFLQSKNLGRYASGAVIPHIYFKDYSKELIPILPSEVQLAIVTELDQISEIISLKRQQIKEYDALAQSLFYELSMNENFAKTHCTIGNCVSEMHIGPFGSALKNDCFVNKEESYCMVYEQQNAIKKTLKLPTRYIDREKYEELKRFKVGPGDIIMSCRGTIGELYRLPENAPIGIIHPSLMLIRLKGEVIDPDYFLFFMKDFVKQQESNGATIKMAITAKKLSAESIPLPPLPLQQSFAEKVKVIERQKALLKQSISETQTLLNSRMQEYFG